MGTLAIGFAVIPDSIVTWIASFQGQFPLIGILLILMLIDIVTGIIAAFIAKTISSSASWSGMGKKVITLLAVAMGAVIEPYAGIPLGGAISLFYIVTEGISITENMDRAGVPVPPPLRDALAKFRDSQKPTTPPVGP